jgi:hypothetical protein
LQEIERFAIEGVGSAAFNDSAGDDAALAVDDKGYP